MREVTVPKMSYGVEATHTHKDGYVQNGVMLARVGSDFKCGALRYEPKSKPHRTYEYKLRAYHETNPKERRKAKDTDWQRHLNTSDTEKSEASSEGDSKVVPIQERLAELV